METFLQRISLRSLVLSCAPVGVAGLWCWISGSSRFSKGKRCFVKQFPQMETLRLFRQHRDKRVLIYSLYIYYVFV